MANVVEVLLRGTDESLGSMLRQAKSDLDGFAEKLGPIGTTLIPAMTTAMVGFKTEAVFKDAIESAARLGEEVHTLQVRTGASAEDASKLAFAFNTLGPGAEAGAVAISRMEANLVKNSTAMDDGTIAAKGVADKWKELGVSVEDANGHMQSGNALLMQMADTFKSMPDGPEKTALAIQTFGRAGANMIPLLNQGSEGLKKMGVDAENLGVVMSGATVESMRNAAIAGKEFDQAMLGIKVVVGEAVLPVLAQAAEGFVKLEEAAHKVASSPVAQFLEKLIGTATGVKTFTDWASAADKSKDSLDKLSDSEMQATEKTAGLTKEQQAQLSIRGELDKANEAQAKGYADVAAALTEAANQIKAGHEFEAKSAEMLASEEEKAHHDAEEAARKQAETETAAANDIHQAHMLAIDGKNLEAQAYVKAAEMEKAGYKELATAAIQSGQEQQHASDVAQKAAEEAQRKSDEAARKAEEEAKREAAAEKQLVDTVESERHSAAMATIAGKQEEAAGYLQAIELEKAGDSSGAKVAIDAGKERQQAADDAAKAAKKEADDEKKAQDEITKWHHEANQAIIKGKQDEAAGYLQAIDLEKAGDHDAAQAAIDAAKEAQSATDERHQAAVKAIKDSMDLQKQELDEFNRNLAEGTNELQHNLAIRHDMRAKDLVTGTDEEKAAKRAVLDADIQLQKAEMALDEAKAQLEDDLRQAELSAKIASDQAVIDAVEATTTAQVTSAGIVAQANATAAGQTAGAWGSAYLDADKAAVAAAQTQVDAAMSAKGAAEDNLASVEALAKGMDHAASSASGMASALGLDINAMHEASSIAGTLTTTFDKLGASIGGATSALGGGSSGGLTGAFGTLRSPSMPGGGGSSGGGSGGGGDMPWYHNAYPGAPNEPGYDQNAWQNMQASSYSVDGFTFFNGFENYKVNPNYAQSGGGAAAAAGGPGPKPPGAMGWDPGGFWAYGPTVTDPKTGYTTTPAGPLGTFIEQWDPRTGTVPGSAHFVGGNSSGSAPINVNVYLDGTLASSTVEDQRRARIGGGVAVGY